MGSSVIEDHSCTTVAVRYRFIYDIINDGYAELLFVPHEVITCIIEEPNDEIEPDPEPANVVYEDDVDYLRSLDPKEWKKQDHYRVLGIKDLRHEASEEVIKTAYRKIVLKHHPDKRKALGEEIRPDDDYFTCITMAYETLGTPIKRRSYDSVDPEFDDTLPSGSELKDNFFTTFSYYFNLNARWSERRNVPKLGRPDASRAAVEHFYSFWYDFKSWREYSYEDEEDKDKCSDRDERRFCEKINKAERQRKKKEEMSRIRSLVDLSYNNDPRIERFKQEEKERKLAAKRARQSAVQAKKEEEERLLKEAQIAREKSEQAERDRIEAKRIEREAQKKILKKERKIFRDTCKTNNYYVQEDGENLSHLQAVDTICETLNLTELEDLNKNLKKNGRVAFLRSFNECEMRIEAERKAVLQAASQKTSEPVKNGKNGRKSKAEWIHDNIQLLIKAVNLFPAGTNQRWEVVANFINQHGVFVDANNKFSAKDVLAQAKELQNTDFSKNDLKEAANKQAFDNFEKDKRALKVVDEAGITTKVDELSVNKKVIKPKNISSSNNVGAIQNNLCNGDTKHELSWTATEQQLLEQALKTYPTSTVDRWDRISECIPNRSKKECMKRYKELVEIIKAKKAAQATVITK